MTGLVRSVKPPMSVPSREFRVNAGSSILPLRSSAQAFDILGQNVGLEIHSVTNAAVAQSGLFVGVGNNPNFKSPLPHGCDRQADSIHGNGSFNNHVAQECRSRAYLEQPVILDALEPREAAKPIDMAGDEMPAQPVPRAERSL